jgi:SAM-dependent methyltransferase
MTPNFLEIICCPACHASLNLITCEKKYGELWQGILQCDNCQATYPLEKGLPFLFVQDDKWLPKAKEAEGWTEHLKSMNLSDPDKDGIDLIVPDHPEEPGIRIKKSLNTMLDFLALTGEETILDLGAGKGWASKQLALLGCNVVALDITADERVGLGSAKALMQHAGTYFERLIGDGENLPFHPNTFDIVFCCGAIHHSSNLPLLMENIHRILKPNGRFCAINEPCIDILADEKQVLEDVAADELALGINENRPNLIKYTDALWQNNFDIQTAFPAQSIDKSREQITIWAYDVAATWRGLPYKGMGNLIMESLRFAKRELKALLLNGVPYIKIRLKSPKERTARNLWAVLLWCETELIFLTRKREA